MERVRGALYAQERNFTTGNKISPCRHTQAAGPVWLDVRCPAHQAYADKTPLHAPALPDNAGQSCPYPGWANLPARPVLAPGGPRGAAAGGCWDQTARHLPDLYEWPHQQYPGWNPAKCGAHARKCGALPKRSNTRPPEYAHQQWSCRPCV